MSAAVCEPAAIQSEQDAGSAGLDARLRAASQAMGGGAFRLELAVPDVHCGGCIRRIERALDALDGISGTRVNLSERRVTMFWTGVSPTIATLALDELGFAWHPLTETASDHDRAVLSGLVKAMAVAGFASGNIMLLSISVWSGAEDATRDLFHWISALIAVPAVIYSGQPFFRSAARALRGRRLNMDVPISLAVLLALVMSLFETAGGGAHAYFDAAVTLLFFLLIGRTLDHLMRRRARRAVTGLADLAVEGAMVLSGDGVASYRRLEEIAVGEHIRIAAGDRVPLDATVSRGEGEVDCSLVSGETTPVAVGPGAALSAGTLNLSGVLEARVTAAADQSFLARMREMMRAAEQGRAPYRRLADRMADIYAPAVHVLALATFLGWLWSTGDWHAALMAAIAVLIITCPCALGLAVPIVQVVAAGRLFEAGVMLRSGTALERLAKVDHVLFDKTGTLTLGQPELTNATELDPRDLRLAAALAGTSKHPLSRALGRILPAGRPVPDVSDIRETPGRGIEGMVDGHAVRLGRPGWAGPDAPMDAGMLAAVVVDGERHALLRFRDTPRPDAAASLGELQASDLALEICSGDRGPAVQDLAVRLGVEEAGFEMMPEDKLRRIQDLQMAGAHVLMVGDGLNDTPVLAAADVSMVPSSAADIGRDRADLVFLRPSLSAVPFAYRVARSSVRLIKQNFALAIAYNCIAVPLAMAGLATPLVAALAMSSSSVLVVLNALRLLRVRNQLAPGGAAVRTPERSAAARVREAAA